ncbi:MAG TPA: 50S ribosomal protein L32 [Patescibacteria group bacterium]|nr:50S ribosomal protein L32 [Patescibacteria group bacterium]
MGALPKRKISRQRQGKRRAARSLTLATLRPCPSCKTLVRPHSACPSCGYYKEGVSVLVAKKETTPKKQA